MANRTRGSSCLLETVGPILPSLSGDLQLKAMLPSDAHIKCKEPLLSAKFHLEILAERQPGRHSNKHILRKLMRRMLRTSILSDGKKTVSDSVMQLRTKQTLS